MIRTLTTILGRRIIIFLRYHVSREERTRSVCHGRTLRSILGRLIKARWALCLVTQRGETLHKHYCLAAPLLVRRCCSGIKPN